MQDLEDLDLLTTEQAARAFKVTPAALKQFRFEHRGPAFFKLGRLVRYARRDLKEYLQANRVGLGAREQK
jgi:hypothetical protein